MKLALAVARCRSQFRLPCFVLVFTSFGVIKSGALRCRYAPVFDLVIFLFSLCAVNYTPFCWWILFRVPPEPQSWDLRDLCIDMHASPVTPRLWLVVALICRCAFFQADTLTPHSITISKRNHTSWMLAILWAHPDRR